MVIHSLLSSCCVIRSPFGGTVSANCRQGAGNARRDVVVFWKKGMASEVCCKRRLLPMTPLHSQNVYPLMLHFRPRRYSSLRFYKSGKFCCGDVLLGKRTSFFCEWRDSLALAGQHRRWQSSDSSRSSSSNPETGSKLSSDHVKSSIQLETKACPTNDVTGQKKRVHKRNKASFSPLAYLTNRHPKHHAPPSPTHLFAKTTHTRKLTRRQLLRLTPRQRSLLKRKQLLDKQYDLPTLNQVRRNVRSNAQFLGQTMDSNLKRNMKTLQSWFKGGLTVNKDEAALDAKSNQGNIMKQIENTSKNAEMDKLELDHIPLQIQKNFQTNLSVLQKFLHNLTGGVVPSPSPSSSSRSSKNTGSSNAANQINNRLELFYSVKRQQGLRMDTKWFAVNIALSLTPATIVALYCLWIQDEMEQFYKDMNMADRKRVLGVESDANNIQESKAHPDTHPDTTNKNETNVMDHFLAGLWHKFKIAVNDLLLEGTNNDINVDQDALDVGEDNSNEMEQPLSPSTNGTNAHAPINTNKEDVTVQMLLQRIQLLEQKLGNNTSNTITNTTDQPVVRELSLHEKQQQHKKELLERYEKNQPHTKGIRYRKDVKLMEEWLAQEKDERIRTDEKNTNSNLTQTNDESYYVSILEGMTATWRRFLAFKEYIALAKKQIETMDDHTDTSKKTIVTDAFHPTDSKNSNDNTTKDTHPAATISNLGNHGVVPTSSQIKKIASVPKQSHKEKAPFQPAINVSPTSETNTPDDNPNNGNDTETSAVAMLDNSKIDSMETDIKKWWDLRLLFGRFRDRYRNNESHHNDDEKVKMDKRNGSDESNKK